MTTNNKRRRYADIHCRIIVQGIRGCKKKRDGENGMTIDRIQLPLDFFPTAVGSPS